jgi:diacylglycerol kinase
MGYWANRVRSIGFAVQGLRVLLTTQPHARIHALASVVVVLTGFYFQVTRLEWVALLLAMAMVWVAEALNTGIELAVDVASPEWHPLAGKAKDVAAAGVLLASFAAVLVGLLIFLPKLTNTV